MERRNENNEYEVEPSVNEMTLPGTIFQSEHENAHAMSDVHVEIPAHDYARAMSNTRDAMLTYETRPENTRETIPVCERVTMPKLPQMSHPEIQTRTGDEISSSLYEAPLRVRELYETPLRLRGLYEYEYEYEYENYSPRTSTRIT